MLRPRAAAHAGTGHVVATIAGAVEYCSAFRRRLVQVCAAADVEESPDRSLMTDGSDFDLA